jgi:hypothetical protein
MGQEHAAPACNVQTAVDAEHGINMAKPTINAAGCRWPRGGETLPGRPGTLNVLADASYSNGEQAPP